MPISKSYTITGLSRRAIANDLDWLKMSATRSSTTSHWLLLPLLLLAVGFAKPVALIRFKMLN